MSERAIPVPMVLPVEQDFNDTGAPRCSSDTARQRVRDALKGGCNCGGTQASMRKRRNSIGALSVALQCDQCGKSLTGSLSRHDFPFYSDFPEWDGDKREAWWKAVQERWEAEHAAARARIITPDQKREEYREVRNTPEWRRFRQAVLARAGFKCEACGKAPAEQAHHLTYAFGLFPPLWEMRAVCRPCHERLHAADDEWHDAHLPARVE